MSRDFKLVPDSDDITVRWRRVANELQIFSRIVIARWCAYPKDPWMQEGVNKPSKAEVFRARLTSTIILWALVTGVFISQNAWAFFGLVSFLTVAGAWEFRNLFSRFPGDGCRVVGLSVGLVVALSTGAFLVTGDQGHDSYFSELAGLITVTVFCFFVRFKHSIEGRQSVDAVGDGLLAFVYVPILFGCFVYRLIFLPGGGGGGEFPELGCFCS